jgi:hypothetical protein
MTKPKRDWTKIRYYPVSLEKLQQASMKEAAILLLPMNIGEDYEHFDEVKHLLDIPEQPKTLDEITQEFDEKIDNLIEKTKRNFYASKLTAERNYEYKFDRIIENFEYAKEHGQFPYLNLAYTTTGLSAYTSPYTETSFVIKQGNKHEGYYTIGNQRYLRYYMPDKPNRLVRFFMKTCLGFVWIDEK